MANKIIHEGLVYLYEINQAFKEWNEEDSFLEKKDETLIEKLLDIHLSKWNSKMFFNSWSYLEKYQDYLIDFETKFSDIEKPDYFLEEFCCKEILVRIEKNNFHICKSLKEHFSSKEIKINGDCFEKEITIDSVFEIYKVIKDKSIKIDLQTLNKINLYLNTLKEEEYYNFIENVKLNIKLHPFQEIGVLFLALNKRAILGDEMGLGKTIQSLSAVCLSESFPCLIVCPSSLKYNWLSESSMIADNVKSEFLNKKSLTSDSDFYIINYESLHNFKDLVKDKNFNSIILDESQYIKNKDAKRTKTIFEIINNITFRFALTGTSIMNNPKDLISQLQSLNQLDHFGNEEKFIEEFCAPKKTKWGTDKSGASNVEVLSKKLRKFCFLRRTKKEVLKELPDKVVSYIPLELKDKTGYKELLKNFSKLKKVEKIGKIEKLRQYVANDKLQMIKNWIDDFLTSNEKLVIFAHHKDIQNKLIEMYPDSAKILSSDSEEIREANKNRFQENEDCKIIICSLKSASLGFTLTASSNVLFVEMDWCSSINIQAEDRCHRIGQKDSVNAWYFIVQGTIEEHIWQVSKEKEKVINQVYCDNNKDSLLEDIDESYLETSVLNEIIELIEKEEYCS